MEYDAVIDTNVLLSALLSKNEDSATVKVLDAVFTGNQKHYPFRDFIVTPAEMMRIIETAEEN